MGLIDYIKTIDSKDYESTFEALIYVIYRNGNNESVKELLNKIGFFTKGEIKISNFNKNEPFLNYLTEIINNINLLLPKITYENSIEMFYTIYSLYKKSIERTFELYISTEIHKFNFIEIFESVMNKIRVSNNLKYSVICIIIKLGEIIEDLNKGLNKGKQRVDMFIKAAKLKEYIENYIIITLEKIKDYGMY
jgi:hypothetical protein